jgi:hypothetical protein
VALGASALLFALWRSLAPARTLAAAAALLLAADLWHYGHGFAAIVPAAEYGAEPHLARRLPAGAPIYVDVDDTAIPRLLPPGLPPAVADLRSQLGRLEPYTPILWGIPYALTPDYDLTATRWSRLALGALERERRGDPDLALRLEGAWGAATRLVRRPDAEWWRELATDPGAGPLRAEGNPYRLPRWRFVPRVTFHAGFRAALAAARSERFGVGAAEHCASRGIAPGEARFAPDARLLAVTDTGGRIDLRYRATAAAFLVVATTFDPGWQALLDGRQLPVLPTALAQLATILPPGEHRVELTYRQPLLRLGAVTSLLGCLAAGAALWWTRRQPGAARE